MPYVYNTHEVNGPYAKRGQFNCGSLEKLSFDQRVEVSDVFHTGSRRLIEEEQPKSLNLTRKSKFEKLRKWFRSDIGCLIVHPSVKEVVETLEPGIHQCLPLELQYAYKPIFDHPWYLLVITQKLDCVDPERSSVKIRTGFDRKPRQVLDLFDEQVVIKPGSLNGEHLWRDRTFPHGILISDSLWIRLKQEKVLISPSFQTMDAAF